MLPSVWLVAAFWLVWLFCVILLRCIEDVHQNLTLDLKTKCFWSWAWWTGLSLKFNDGYGLELVFRLNSNSCLLGSELKFIFHCTAHSKIFVRSMFKSAVLVVISCTVENKEVSSVKSFGSDYKPLDKSFM